MASYNTGRFVDPTTVLKNDCDIICCEPSKQINYDLQRRFYFRVIILSSAWVKQESERQSPFK